jgi:hypothetical protein
MQYYLGTVILGIQSYMSLMICKKFCLQMTDASVAFPVVLN